MAYCGLNPAAPNFLAGYGFPAADLAFSNQDVYGLHFLMGCVICLPANPHYRLLSWSKRVVMLHLIAFSFPCLVPLYRD